ncbi:UDP-N-acetylmuramoyl-tripeptide--D-alanyl-D-alanine ligase [Psychrobacillus insolitus]|uniref:UDP-N-acetylmuramoyl-tripeptide--D-alanyl-D-alanine ligase n=1 Tax=Psychrobacillus insolitus TaxID=1461 RepID=A0A2W7M9S9_9BACI|nr:UDP-N-acetylmuramoyl-tripeptide--D-alanyl-D-alanine ligase [Psychrobacillus insolitus]PZX01614.1 UDP-N-acetylmuramoyl-tripeptide--D-alanyl-D-alanine ligase [Psychrobacillus insolitus]
MKPFSVKEIRLCVNGQLIQGSDEFMVNDMIYHITKMEPNKLIFLRQKSRIDWEKIAQSVPCVVVTDSLYAELELIENYTIIKVQDIEQAFWKFVDFYRDQFSIPVVSVTGTNGKTTTKDMIRHILSFDRIVTGTKHSANSRTHHLTYLLSIEKDTDAAVFESAVGEPGDVLLASRYYKPTIGIITNIGVYHLDGCKTPEAYLQAKAEMVQAVGSKGTLIVNADDENTKKIGLKEFQGKVLTFGVNNHADFQATKIQYGDNGMHFELTLKKRNLFSYTFKEKYSIFVPGYGQHQVLNALAAFVAVHEMGIDISVAAKRIQSFHNLRAHLECNIGMGGCIILDDTWSSTPGSLKAAFETLNGISRGKKRIALIGDIKRLGNFSLDFHRQTGDMIAENGVDVLITVGSMAVEIAKQAELKGLHGKVYSFPNIHGVELLLEKILDENSILLIKSSSTNDAIVNLKSKLKLRMTD